MFMNARPQIVSNAFETFVPSRKPEPVHQRLVKMTNSKVNAGSNFWPVSTAGNDRWDYSFDDGHGNENSEVSRDTTLTLDSS